VPLVYEKFLPDALRDRVDDFFYSITHKGQPRVVRPGASALAPATAAAAAGDGGAKNGSGYYNGGKDAGW